MPGVWTGYIACMSGPIGMGVECAAEGMSAAYHVRLRPVADVQLPLAAIEKDGIAPLKTSMQAQPVTNR